MGKKIFLLALLLIIVTQVSRVRADSGLSTISDVEVASYYYDPNPVLKGQYTSLYVDLYNAGDQQASGVEFKLLPQYPFFIDTGESTDVNIPSLGPHVSSLLQFKVRVAADAVSGINQLPYDIINSGQPQTHDINITIASQNNVRITKVTPSILTPGQQIALTFTLQNAGNSFVQGLTLSWNEASKLIVPIGSENQVYIASLAPNENKDVTFNVISDPAITPGVYELNVNFSYQNSNSTSSSTTSQSSTVGIVVGGPADLDVNVQSYTNGQIALAVSNIGTNPASAVSISLPPQGSLLVAEPTSQFLGNLLKGDFTVATFQTITPSQTANSLAQNASRRRFMNGSSDSITVQISYTDTLGNRQAITKQVPFNMVLASLGAGGTGARVGRTQGTDYTPYYIIGAIVIVIAAYYLKNRKKKVAVS